MSKRLNVLFVHNSWPNQFSLLHKYFRGAKLVNSYFLTTESDRRAYQFQATFPDQVFSYAPDGEVGQNSYYYSGPAESNARHAINVLNACKAIVTSRAIDVVVAHGILGAPYMLFDELDCAIVAYVEFPSFRQHGWDPQYPPHDGQRLCDKFEEMLNYFAAIKADAVVTPSLYAKSMFPASLQPKVHVQMEGFDPQALSIRDEAQAAFRKQPGLTYVGFSARTMTSEKGLEHFVRVSRRLSQLNPNVRFVLIGAEKGGSYGFENLFLEKLQPPASLKEHLFAKYAVDESLYISTGPLDGVAFWSTLHAVDFFLYPLQYGSANWGFYELLLRGKIIVAVNRCFMPEVIVPGENGFLVDNDDIEGCARLCDQIARNLENYAHIGRAAATTGERFHIVNAARDYARLLRGVVRKRNDRRSQSAESPS